MKFPKLLIVALAFSPIAAQAGLMLDKPLTGAILQREGNPAPTAEDVKRLAHDLQREYGLKVFYLERGNTDPAALKELELVGVKSAGHFGSLKYSRKLAADPTEVAYLQLLQVQKAMQKLSPRERTKVRQREVDILLFAEARLRDHRLVQRDNELAIVNAARAQSCQRVGRENRHYWDESDRELVQGLNQGLKSAGCPVGVAFRAIKDVGGKIFNNEADNQVAYLHSRDYVVDQFRHRILGPLPSHDHDARRAERPENRSDLDEAAVGHVIDAR